MRKLSTSAAIFSIAIPIFLFGVAVPKTASAVEQINDFDVRIEVQKNGTVIVEEMIEYRLPEGRHGIFRNLPLVYDDSSSKWSIPLTVESVTDGQGQSWPYEENRGTYGLQIKIGDPERTVSGDQTYVIRYLAEGALRYFEDHDELYWNVTGTDWEVPILKSSAEVSLPDGVIVSATRCFVGGYGSDSEECVKVFSGNVASFSADGPLTVVVGWPPGLVERLLPKRYVNWKWPIPFVLPAVVFAFMYRIWRKHGNDTGISPTLVVQYDPPDSLPPAEVGTLLDGQADMRDITASIVDLAVRGYIRIEETEKKGLLLNSKDYRLVLKNKGFRDDSALKPYETTILETFFGKGDEILLSLVKEKYLFRNAIKKIKGQLGDQVVKDGYFPADPMKTRAKWAVPVAVLAFGSWFAAPLLLAIPAFLGLNLVISAISWFLSILIIGIFGWFMPKMTQKGALAFGHAKGFREYVTRAEKYRVQWQEKENIFEKFLPFAMVFGVSEKWAKAFDGIEMRQPDWYEGSAFRSGAFNAAAFAPSFDSLSKSMSSAVMSSPSKSGSGSGFGGGGFSGGGGGGGGGGSW